MKVEDRKFSLCFRMGWFTVIVAVLFVYFFLNWTSGYRVTDVEFIVTLLVLTLPLVWKIAYKGCEVFLWGGEIKEMTDDSAQLFFADILEYDDATKKAKVQVLDKEGNPTGEVIDDVVMVEKINLADNQTLRTNNAG